MNLLLMCLLVLSSCSFKKKNDANTSQTKNQIESQTTESDSDGDGVTDADEITRGSDPFLADIPTFSGDFFEEMEVKLELYNKLNNGYVSIDWKTIDGKTKFSWEEEDRISASGGLYMETLLKSYAGNFNFKKNNFKFYDYNEGIFSYSSPVFFEDSLFSISDKLLSLQRKGYEINRAEATILSAFQINSKKYVSFRNPVFDIYYKSRNHEGLIFIESKRIDGTYSFNEENKVNIHFESFDSKIIDESLLSGGASFFLKLRDFTVYETNEDYSSILERVQISSVPVTIAYTSEDKKSIVETLYVGTRGNPESLQSILIKAFKKDVLMTSTSIDQIRGLSNRSQSYEGTGLNETIKWYVGSSHIEDNVYSYLFKPNEGIGLAYISDKKVEKKPIFVSRITLATTQHSASSGKLPFETRDLKIKFVPLTLQVPVEKYITVVLPNCPKDQNWETNQVTYKKVVEGWADKIKDFAGLFPADAYLAIKTAKGSILEGNLQALVKDKFLIINKDSGNGFSLTLSASIAQQVQKEKSQVSVEVLLVPKKVNIDIGRLDITGQVCQKETPDTQGTGHIKSGSNAGPAGVNMGVGVSGVGFEYKYDLDIHFFSY